MRNRWFGEPWPSAEKRAPICDDDAYRVITPDGKPCLYCPDPIQEDERGVVMPSFGIPAKSFEMRIPGIIEKEDGVPLRDARAYTVVVVHIDCLMRSTVGPELEAMLSELADVQRVPR